MIETKYSKLVFFNSFGHITNRPHVFYALVFINKNFKTNKYQIDVCPAIYKTLMKKSLPISEYLHIYLWEFVDYKPEMALFSKDLMKLDVILNPENVDVYQAFNEIIKDEYEASSVSHLHYLYAVLLEGEEENYFVPSNLNFNKTQIIKILEDLGKDLKISNLKKQYLEQLDVLALSLLYMNILLFGVYKEVKIKDYFTYFYFFKDIYFTVDGRFTLESRIKYDRQEGCDPYMDYEFIKEQLAYDFFARYFPRTYPAYVYSKPKLPLDVDIFDRIKSIPLSYKNRRLKRNYKNAKKPSLEIINFFAKFFHMLCDTSNSSHALPIYNRLRKKKQNEEIV